MARWLIKIGVGDFHLFKKFSPQAFEGLFHCFIIGKAYFYFFLYNNVKSTKGKVYVIQRLRVCDVCVANMGEDFEKARTAYTLLADVNKFIPNLIYQLINNLLQIIFFTFHHFGSHFSRTF